MNILHLTKSHAQKFSKMKMQYRHMSQLPQMLNITFFVNKFNSLSQRARLELERRNHQVSVFEIESGNEMVDISRQNKHDLIICPFLTKRVPAEVWGNKTTPCLIVHPGIEGDQGMHSLDWTIKGNLKEWGVTVLQASKDMDAGDVWATTNFQIKRDNRNTATKSSLYANEVTQAAVSSILQAVENYQDGVPPRPLDFSNPNVKGRLQRKMKESDRIIDWKDSADTISRQIRMSDSQPGATAELSIPKEKFQDTYQVYGSLIEMSELQFADSQPGEIVGHRDHAILVKCGDGLVWLSHLRKKKLKLPSTLWLKETIKTTQSLPLSRLEYPYGSHPQTFQEIWTNVTPDGICYLHFNFYNGAMSTFQCKCLERILAQIQRDNRINTIVLMGGYNYFSNGIHLNVIEHTPDSFVESWKNINAINDVVKRIFKMPKLIISALQGNAGAGGCMMALASDYVWCRDGVVTNPHYKSMCLFGSEYHTYFLKARVGQGVANELTSSTKPLLSSKAVEIGMFDQAMGRTVEDFCEEVHERAQILNKTVALKKQRAPEAFFQALEEHRENELSRMVKNFKDPSYHEARQAFVYH